MGDCRKRKKPLGLWSSDTRDVDQGSDGEGSLADPQFNSSFLKIKVDNIVEHMDRNPRIASQLDTTILYYVILYDVIHL